MIYYILHIEDKPIFLKTATEITEDYTVAMRFSSIGEAMRVSSDVFSKTGAKFKLLSLYENL